jgi:hypothetical protein
VVSTAAAAARATANGTLPVGGSTPCDRRSAETNSRKTTGSPSVTKYAAPGVPRSAARTSASATLSTCVVSVRWRPPPIQRNCPLRTISTIAGTSVVSPRPHTNRGRTMIVSRSSRFAATTATSASALVAV